MEGGARFFGKKGRRPAIQLHWFVLREHLGRYNFAAIFGIFQYYVNDILSSFSPSPCIYYHLADLIFCDFVVEV